MRGGSSQQADTNRKLPLLVITLVGKRARMQVSQLLSAVQQRDHAAGLLLLLFLGRTTLVLAHLMTALIGPLVRGCYFRTPFLGENLNQRRVGTNSG